MAETRSVPGSPLPQNESRVGVQAVRLTQGFFAQLPSQSVTFFERQHIADYPRPIQIGAGTAYPRPVTLFEHVVPQGEVVVIRDAVFGAAQHNGLGIDDLIPVNNKRLLSYVAFVFDINSKLQTDAQNNAYGIGGVLAKNAISQGKAALSAAAQVPATARPWGGSIATGPAGSFALYAMPQQKIRAVAWIVQPPPFEIRQFSLDVSGWTLPKASWERIKTGFNY